MYNPPASTVGLSPLRTKKFTPFRIYILRQVLTTAQEGQHEHDLPNNMMRVSTLSLLYYLRQKK